jgi:WD40 repeat protein
VPAALAEATARAAAAFAAGGKAAVSAGVPARVATLAEGSLKAMFITRLTIVTALLVAAGGVAGGAGLLARQRPAPPPQEKPAEAGKPMAEAAGRTRPDGAGHTDAFGDPLPAGALARIGTVRLRHAGWVRGVAFSPDGKTLASGGQDGVIRFWDPATGKQLRLLTEHSWAVASFAFSPDGTLVASTGYGRPDVIRLWDFAAGKEVGSLRGKNVGGGRVAFSPDGKTLAAGGGDARIRLWDVKTGRELHNLPGHETSRLNLENPVRGLAFSPDGKWLASCGQDGSPNGLIRVWETATGKQAFVLRSRDGMVEGFAFADGGKALVSGGHFNRSTGPGSVRGVGTLRLWDLSLRKQVREFKDDLEPEDVVAVALSPDGETVAAGFMDKTVRLWDVASGKLLRRLRGHQGGDADSYKLAFSPDGKTLASGGNDNAVYLWDVATGRRLLQDAPAHEGAIRSVALSADGKVLATAGEDQTVCLWATATGKRTHELRGHESRVWAVALSPDGRTVASGSWDGTVRLWDAATGKPLHKLRTGDFPKGAVSCVAFSPDGKLLASGQPNNPKSVNKEVSGLTLWEVSTGKELRRSAGPPGGPLSVCFSRDGKTLLAVGEDGTLCHRQVATGKETRQFTLTGPDRDFSRLMPFSPGGEWAATSHFDGSVVLHDTSTGQQKKAFRVARRGISCAALSPDSRFVASCYAGGWRPDDNYDQTIRVWEAASGQEVLRFDLPPRTGVKAAAFAPDGRTLFTGMNDTTTLVWDLVPRARGAPADLKRERLEGLWADLAGGDSARAYRALWALALSPDRAVPLLAERLRPAGAADVRRIRRLCTDLDSDEFAVRSRAQKELEKLGAEAVPTLREVLAGGPSFEVRKRLESLLVHASAGNLTAEELRQVRALAVLERAGTPEARKVLAALAGGRADARLTREAKASLERLAGR